MRDVRPILILDFDDVICRNDACGGFDMVSAISQVERNEAAQEAFELSWRPHLESIAKPSLATALRQAGLDFVVANVRPTWEAVKSKINCTRVQNIANRVEQHYDFFGRCVVLDGEHSGGGLARRPVNKVQPFVVLCRADVGMTQVVHTRPRSALLARSESAPASHLNRGIHRSCETSAEPLV